MSVLARKKTVPLPDLPIGLGHIAEAKGIVGGTTRECCGANSVGPGAGHV